MKKCIGLDNSLGSITLPFFFRGYNTPIYGRAKDFYGGVVYYDADQTDYRHRLCNLVAFGNTESDRADDRRCPEIDWGLDGHGQEELEAGRRKERR